MEYEGVLEELFKLKNDNDELCRKNESLIGELEENTLYETELKGNNLSDIRAFNGTERHKSNNPGLIKEKREEKLGVKISYVWEKDRIKQSKNSRVGAKITSKAKNK